MSTPVDLVDAAWTGPGPVSVPGHGVVEPGQVIPVPRGEAEQSSNWTIQHDDEDLVAVTTDPVKGE